MSGATRCVAGVDAGASHTAAVVTDPSLRVLGRAAGAPGAVRSDTVDRAADVIMRTVSAARADAVGATALDTLVVGAAGSGDPAIRAALAQALRAHGAPPHTTVCTDADAAFASAFPDGPGILLLSGTGSIALARDAGGGRHRTGGRGWRLGDEGSGYALGRAGAAAAVQALDGRAPPTTLTASVATALGCAVPAELFRWAADAEPRDIAMLGKLVQEAAQAGDAVALGLLDGAADDLVAHLTALRPHFAGATAVPVVLAGGALVQGRPLRRRVVTLVGARVPWAAILDTEIDAALGAARMALGEAPGCPT